LKALVRLVTKSGAAQHVKDNMSEAQCIRRHTGPTSEANASLDGPLAVISGELTRSADSGRKLGERNYAMDVDIRPCASAEEVRQAISAIGYYFGRSAANEDQTKRFARVLPVESAAGWRRCRFS
jgi:hypothetical protein